MIEFLRLGQIGDGEQVVRLEIGNDNGGAVFQDLLGLGGNVAVGRDDQLLDTSYCFFTPCSFVYVS